MPINSFLYPATQVVSGYEVANSLRFNDGSSDYLNRTQGTPTNADKYTLSVWVKRCGLTTSDYHYIASFDGGSNPREHIRFNDTTDQLTWYFRDSGGTATSLTTNRLFRDVSAWYHIVCSYDSTQSTSSNRQKIYINGVQETSFSSSGYVAQNTDANLNTNSNNIKIGALGVSSPSAGFFDGYMAEYVFIDGQALDPTSFGEFDEDSGIWKPKNVSGLTFGTNGFYLDFENSGSLGADVSGNSNNFTVNNLTSADQTPDTCTNNFATLNPLGFAGTIPTFSQGNLNVVVGSGASLYSVSTIGVSSGKWYVEGELEQAAISGGSYYVDYGFHDRADSLGQSYYVSDGRMFWLSSWDGKINYRTGGTDTIGLVTGLATLTPGDFFQLYLDMDNELMYWGKNGSLLNTTGVSFNGKESLTGEYFFAFGDQYTNGTHEWGVNFGQGSIDGNAVSNFQDANGYGNFKYNPTVTTDEGSKDFLALCTKNLAEYG